MENEHQEVMMQAPTTGLRIGELRVVDSSLYVWGRRDLKSNSRELLKSLDSFIIIDVFWCIVWNTYVAELLTMGGIGWTRMSYVRDYSHVA